jgi:hypothetical protein
MKVRLNNCYDELLVQQVNTKRKNEGEIEQLLRRVASAASEYQKKKMKVRLNNCYDEILVQQVNTKRKK